MAKRTIGGFVFHFAGILLLIFAMSSVPEFKEVPLGPEHLRWAIVHLSGAFFVGVGSIISFCGTED